jgi:hypothetical protein
MNLDLERFILWDSPLAILTLLATMREIPFEDGVIGPKHMSGVCQVRSRPGGGVICETRALQAAVIPAKAGMTGVS